MYSENVIHALAAETVTATQASPTDTAAKEFFSDRAARLRLNITAATPGAGCGTASFATSVMSVDSVVAGTYFNVGQVVESAGVAKGTVILSQASGTPGGIGTYNLSTTPGTIASQYVAGIQTAAIGTASFATNVMTAAAPTSGAYAVGQVIVAAGVAAGTTISSFGTGSGGAGTYNLSTSPGTIASEPVAAFSAAGTGTATFSTNVMTVTGVTDGVFAVGQTVVCAGVTAGTTITSLGTGTGGTGTYNLSTSPGTLGARNFTAYTAPSITVDVLGTINGNDAVLGSFTAHTGPSNESIVIDACPRLLKTRHTITGTTPSFTFEVVAVRF